MLGKGLLCARAPRITRHAVAAVRPVVPAAPDARRFAVVPGRATRTRFAWRAAAGAQREEQACALRDHQLAL